MPIYPAQREALSLAATDLLPGLSSLPARCPFAPEVELALDASGQLHAAMVCPEHPESRLAELMIAASWAEAHAGLLLGPRATRGRGHATLHLITESPKHARRLLDTPVRIHALGATGEGDSRRWCVIDLN
jgi:hypothetical protein